MSTLICLARYIQFSSNHIGIEAQLHSQEDKNNGISVNFPMSISDIPIQSEIPSSVISMQYNSCSYLYACVCYVVLVS